jgi:hypothetical protein
VPGPPRTFTLIVKIPSTGRGVAVSVGGEGVRLGVCEGDAVGTRATEAVDRGTPEAVGEGFRCGLPQELASIGSKTNKKNFFIGIILLLLNVLETAEFIKECQCSLFQYSFVLLFNI